MTEQPEEISVDVEFRSGLYRVPVKWPDESHVGTFNSWYRTDCLGCHKAMIPASCERVTPGMYQYKLVFHCGPCMAYKTVLLTLLPGEIKP